jgi:hypothetical protein
MHGTDVERSTNTLITQHIFKRKIYYSRCKLANDSWQAKKEVSVKWTDAFFLFKCIAFISELIHHFGIETLFHFLIDFHPKST